MERSDPKGYVVDEPLTVGGIEGKNLGALAEQLVSETPPHRRQNHLRYVLEQSLHILDAQLAGKGIE